MHTLVRHRHQWRHACSDRRRQRVGRQSHYLTYPVIDINSSGTIGMTYMRSGTDTATDEDSLDSECDLRLVAANLFAKAFGVLGRSCVRGIRLCKSIGSEANEVTCRDLS
jgi:hypothetical protein